MGECKLIRKASGGGGIKSIQRGTYNFINKQTQDLTISEVDLNKSIVICNAYGVNGTTENEEMMVLSKFVDSTTIRLYTPYGDDIVKTLNIDWEVIEFDNVKSVQSGEFTGTPGVLIPISTVDISKSMIFFTVTANTTTSSYPPWLTGMSFYDSNNIMARNSAFSSVRVSWFVVEFA